MGRFKLHIALLLLALFSVTVVPKSVWHDCDHDHVEYADTEHDSFSGDDCPVCEFNFSSYSPTQPPVVIHQDQFFHGYAWELHTFDGVLPTTHLPSRAPPRA